MYLCQFYILFTIQHTLLVVIKIRLIFNFLKTKTLFFIINGLKNADRHSIVSLIKTFYSTILLLKFKTIVYYYR